MEAIRRAQTTDKGTGKATAALFAVLTALLVWRWLLAFFWLDQANCGLLALAALAGRWPIFVYGANFMGALDGYLAAPLVGLFGPSALVWNFFPILYYLLTVWVLYRALRRVVPGPGAVVGLCYLAVPPAELLFHAGHALTHYSLSLLLGALIVYQTVVLWQAERWRPHLTFLWGLFAGLGLWTNSQTAVVIAPAGLFLALFRLMRARPLNLLAGGLGAALGAAPLIYYKLAYGYLDPPMAAQFSMEWAARNWPLLAHNAMPQVLGLNLPPGQAAVDGPGRWLYLSLVGLNLLCMLALLWRARRKGGRIGLMLWGVALCNIGVLVFSWYGQNLQWTDFRYLLPLYLVLPFAWAAAASLWRARWLPWALAIFLVVIHVGGYATYRGHNVLDQGAFYFKEEPKYRRIIGAARRAEIKGVYVGQSQEWAFLAEERPQFCQTPAERRIFAVTQVDAMEKPAFMMPLGAELAFVGAHAKSIQTRVNIPYQVMGPLYYDMTLPYEGRALLDRGSWAPGPETPAAAALFDDDLSSGMHSGDEAMVIDLGQVRKVCAVALAQAGFEQTPVALKLELLGPDMEPMLERQWDSQTGPLYWSGPHLFNKVRYPRLEAHFAPVMARWIRISGVAGRPGPVGAMVGEVLAWTTAKPDPAGWTESGRLLLAPLHMAGVSRVYADAWPSAFIRQAAGDDFKVLLSNWSTDDFGHADPPPGSPEVIAAGPGAAVVIDSGSREQASRALARWGCAHRILPAGRFSLLLLDKPHLGPEVPIKAVEASVNPGAAPGLLAGGRWDSAGPQEPGISLTLDVGRSRHIGRVAVYNPTYVMDYPRGLAFEVSDDGQAWRPVKAELAGPLVMAGPALLKARTPESHWRLEPGTRGRYLRLTLDGADPHFYWTVEGLRLWGAEG